MAAAGSGQSCSTRPRIPGSSCFLFQGEEGRAETNLRGKGTVSMSKTPLEWANLRSAGQVPRPVPREGGRVGG